MTDDGEPLQLGGAKRRALLALLLLRPGEVLPRERLIDRLWGESPPDTAANAVQVHIHGLRKLLGADRVTTHGTSYSVRVDPGELDLQRFEELVGRGNDALGCGDAERAAAALHEALALWRGQALADLTDEPFVGAERARLEEQRLAALEQRIEADLQRGRHAELVGELESLVREHPYRERLRRHLILSLYRSGRQAEALELLREQLGSELFESLRAEGRALPEALMLAEAHPQGAQR